MSIKAIQTVLDESHHKGSALLLMVILANYAHDDGTYAFPSVATMTKYTRLTRRNVQLLLRKLEESGELAEMGIHNSGTVIYRLVLPGLSKGGVNFTPPKQRGAKATSERGDQGITGGASPATPDPSSIQQQPLDQDQESKDGIPTPTEQQIAWKRTQLRRLVGDLEEQRIYLQLAAMRETPGQILAALESTHYNLTRERRR